MKRLLRIVTTLCMVFLMSTSVFADRVLLIPDVPKTPYRGGIGAYEGVVAHSTATPEAPAINIQKYETRTWRNAFVHYAVDWNETIQIADTNYIAYGAGPAANQRFVHVELCETADYAKFKRSYEKYVKLLAKILQDKNLSVEKGLWTHNDVRKYLGGTNHEDPIDYLRSHGVSESQFRSDVQRVYNDSNEDEPTGGDGPVVHTQSIAYILGNNVNLRKGPGTNYGMIRQLNKPEVYQVWGEKDGWLNLGGEQWMKYNPEYIRFERKEAVNSIIGKRAVSKVNNLRFYEFPSWQDSAVAGTLDAGEGFTIDEKVIVEGSPQFKVHNRKGRTYYMTSSEAFVYVK
ncbi:peptidoglycan recognition protein family protein [Bacillus toyonensis]|uniref:peptidoglycan recognition protein family protein n=1 Tax=Bacillus toyonensis TaxID=155322 RepID=UPI000BF56532|nr:peptidoglycan recognition family protein [Bacillus toyonensis]PGC93943.1 N-acetylmuramoyl-L-alanine amidase [Bacillus toyonensis]